MLCNQYKTLSPLDTLLEVCRGQKMSFFLSRHVTCLTLAFHSTMFDEIKEDLVALREKMSHLRRFL